MSGSLREGLSLLASSFRRCRGPSRALEAHSACCDMLPPKAVNALKSALVNQFGESARSTVESEVASFLQGRTLDIRQSLRAAASRGGLPELLASRAPGVIVFGADYCGPCKVLLGRLERLGLLGPKASESQKSLIAQALVREGAVYADAEDLAPGGGADLLNAVLAGAPFSPPLPVLAVLGPGELQRLEAGQELLTLADDELTALTGKSDRRRRRCPFSVRERSPRRRRMIAGLSPQQPVHPRVYWVKAHVATVPTSPRTVSLPSSCVSSPVVSHRTLAAPSAPVRLSCTRLYSQPTHASTQSFEPIRQVSAPCQNPFPRTPRIELRPEPFPPRVTIATRLASVDSPRNTILAATPQGVATPPVEAHVPVKIRSSAPRLQGRALL
eukprot:s3241_g5.t1